MQKVIPAAALASHVASVIDCFTELLSLADISAYDIQTRAGKNISNTQDAEADEFQEEDDDTKGKDVDMFETKIIINQENDIVQIIEGFLKILDHCLGTKRTEDSQEERDTRAKLHQLGREGMQDRFGFFSNLFGLFSDSSNDVPRDVNEELKKTIYENAGKILSACINCWNDIDIYRPREFFFTTLGIFQYNDEDKIQIKRQIDTDKEWIAHLQGLSQPLDKSVSNQQRQNTEMPTNSKGLLDQYHQYSFNPI